jgi:hypothetical protein
MLVIFLNLFHQMPEIEWLWHHFLVWVSKKSINIPTYKRAAGVAYCHAIGIDHGHYLENALFS